MSSGATRSIGPALSVVIVIVSDTMEQRAQTGPLADCLEALAQQVDAPEFEIIIPCHGETDGIDALSARFPAVRFVVVADPAIASRRVGSREHHDVLRARGLELAQGALVALLEDHARPDPHWCAASVDAHKAGVAAMGGAIENDIDAPLNWAVYFCDFSRYQNPVPSGDSAFASDANTVYKRTELDAVRPLWQQRFQEVIVNGALRAAGKRVALSPEMIVYQHRAGLRLNDALAERFVWGRSYAVTRSAQLGRARRSIHALLSPVLPLVLMLRMTAIAWKRRRLFGKFVRSAPLVALLVLSWSAGECAGYLGAPAA